MAKRGSRAKKGTTLWREFDGFREARNSLIHPRKGKYKPITAESARECNSRVQESDRVCLSRLRTKGLSFSA